MNVCEIKAKIKEIEELPLMKYEVVRPFKVNPLERVEPPTTINAGQ